MSAIGNPSLFTMGMSAIDAYKDVKPWEKQGINYFHEKKWHKATKCFQKAIYISLGEGQNKEITLSLFNPFGSPPYHLWKLLGCSLYKEKNWTGASDAFTLFLTVKSQRDVFLSRAKTYIRLEEWNLALSDAKAILKFPERDTLYAEAFAIAALAYFGQERYLKAYQACKRALKRDPFNPKLADLKELARQKCKP